VPRFRVTLEDPSGPDIDFFTGELEFIELRWLIYAAARILAVERPGLVLHVQQIPREEP
jgi:hypothetical protein